MHDQLLQTTRAASFWEPGDKAMQWVLLPKPEAVTAAWADHTFVVFADQLFGVSEMRGSEPDAALPAACAAKHSGKCLSRSAAAASPAPAPVSVLAIPCPPPWMLAATAASFAASAASFAGSAAAAALAVCWLGLWVHWWPAGQVKPAAVALLMQRCWNFTASPAWGAHIAQCRNSFHIRFALDVKRPKLSKAVSKQRCPSLWYHKPTMYM